MPDAAASNARQTPSADSERRADNPAWTVETTAAPPAIATSQR